ncbi:hypothetical protein JKA74_02320 [Marivirga sp. S37H4]|uniref:Uncharacterized protein n=1 Tax=Marivirga aurantiaca TaxID=2802615 RepID=A0A934WVL2_9BACT|nr:hypothetical protein [Marivirga aurantiaca]MBK6263858.1 hypothetical protein [Marivirga aurantiaca]
MLNSKTVLCKMGSFLTNVQNGFICLALIIVGLVTSCTDDNSSFEPEQTVYIIQDNLSIDGYLKEKANQLINISVTPHPENGNSIAGTLSVVGDQENFNQIATSELSRQTFDLNKENNYTDEIIVSLIPIEELNQPTSTSFSIEMNLLDRDKIGTNPGNFNITFNYAWQRHMDLMNLKKGQIFRYVLLWGSDYYHSDTFYYSGDTLQLEVLEVNGDSLLISETITDLSNMKFEQDYSYSWFSDRDAVHTNYWIMRNDSLIFEPISGRFKSHLIGHDHMTDIPYNINLSLRLFNEEEVEITGWRTSYPYTEDHVELFTNNYSLFGNQYDHLNINIYNLRLGSDAFGFTTVYSKEYGIIKTSKYLFFTKSGIGWDKL